VGVVWVLGMLAVGVVILDLSDKLAKSRREGRLLRDALMAQSEQVPGGRIESADEIERWLHEAGS
jgi:hypothetical protein